MPAAKICIQKLRQMQYKASVFLSTVAAHLFSSGSTVLLDSTLPLGFHCFSCSLERLVLLFGELSLGYFRCHISSLSEITVQHGIKAALNPLYRVHRTWR